MKTYLAACFVVCLPIMKMDSVEIHFRQKLQYKNITIAWDSFIIEQAVKEDGTPGPHAVNINLLFESGVKKANWSLTLPAGYNDHFKDHGDQVTFSFEDFAFQIVGGDLNSFERGFLKLNISVIPAVRFLIDHKSVSEKKFKSMLESLKEKEGTWFCTETTEGGITGYEATDDKGNTYTFRAESKQKGSISSLTLLPR